MLPHHTFILGADLIIYFAASFHALKRPANFRLSGPIHQLLKNRHSNLFHLHWHLDETSCLRQMFCHIEADRECFNIIN